MPWEYTDEQKESMDFGNNYGFQTNPLYDKDRNQYKKYQQGDDRKGKLTRFLTPMRIAHGVQREGMVDDYYQEAGGTQGGFAQSGAQLAAGAARLRRESDRDYGNTEASAYVMRGEQLHDRVTSAYEAAMARELQARGIAANVSNNPHYRSTWGDFWKGVLGSVINKAAGVGMAVATGGASEFAGAAATGNIGTGGAAGGTGVGGWGGPGASGYAGGGV